MKLSNLVLLLDILRMVKKPNYVVMSDNKVWHVIPHGRDFRETFELLVADKLKGVTEYTKQYLSINNSYTIKILKNFKK